MVHKVSLTLSNGAQIHEPVLVLRSSMTWQALAREVAQWHGYGGPDIYRIVIDGTEYNKLDL